MATGQQEKTTKERNGVDIALVKCIALLLSEIDETPIDEDFLSKCFRFNDGGSVWWSAVGSHLIKAERAELEDDYGDDASEWQLSVELECAKHPAVAVVPLYRRSQLICFLRGFGVEG